MFETEVALLDEVEQVHALGQWVTTCDRDHEAEVGADEPVLRRGGIAQIAAKGCTTLARFEALGRIATSLDGLGELALVLGSQQGDLANFVQIETN